MSDTQEFLQTQADAVGKDLDGLHTHRDKLAAQLNEIDDKIRQVEREHKCTLRALQAYQDADQNHPNKRASWNTPLPRGDAPSFA